MTKLDTLSISFQSKEYLVAIIPDIISDGNHELLIGPQSLNNALYNDAIGYSDSAASDIDEKIYKCSKICLLGLHRAKMR